MEHNRHTDYAGNIELISCSGGKNIMAGGDKLHVAIQMSLHNCFKLVNSHCQGICWACMAGLCSWFT